MTLNYSLLNANSGIKIPEMTIDYKHFMDRTTTIFGPTGTGKTVIIKNILHILKDHVDQVIVVSPSEPSNNSYKGIIESPLIHYRMHLPGDDTQQKGKGKSQSGLRFLEAIWKRQEMMAAIYNKANNIKILAQLYSRISSSECDRNILKIKQFKVEETHRISKQFVADPGKKDAKLKMLYEQCDQLLIINYKKFISKKYKKLIKKKTLSDNEIYSLVYLHFNPKLILIFDDCASQLNELANSNVFRMLFYQNRHSFITFILSCQDDTDLPANLRKNAFSSFFTSDIVASANFTRASNQFPKETRKYVETILPVVFSEENRKLVYIREDKQHFYHIKFPIPPPFKFGSVAIHELCECIKADASAIDDENPYFQHFKL